MYNCDHCKKKYKRSWHQVRHNQMKHENSNTSTATSSGTPPTPEIINGNLNLPSANNTINNNNVNSFHQTIHQPLSNSPQQMPSTTPQHQTTNQHIQEPMSQDISNIAAQSAQTIIPPIVHQHQSQPQSQPQTIWNNHQISPHSVHNSPQQAHHQTHLGYGSDMMDTSKNYVAPPPINNGQYVHYDMNDQYSGMQNPAPQQVSYDSWVREFFFTSIQLNFSIISCFIYLSSNRSSNNNGTMVTNIFSNNHQCTSISLSSSQQHQIGHHTTIPMGCIIIHTVALINNKQLRYSSSSNRVLIHRCITGYRTAITIIHLKYPILISISNKPATHPMHQ